MPPLQAHLKRLRPVWTRPSSTSRSREEQARDVRPGEFGRVVALDTVHYISQDRTAGQVPMEPVAIMASKKSVNAENLAALGAQRLAAILMDLAEHDAETKRRLRLELAGQAGGD